MAGRYALRSTWLDTTSAVCPCQQNNEVGEIIVTTSHRQLGDHLLALDVRSTLTRPSTWQLPTYPYLHTSTIPDPRTTIPDPHTSILVPRSPIHDPRIGATRSPPCDPRRGPCPNWKTELQKRIAFRFGIPPLPLLIPREIHTEHGYTTCRIFAPSRPLVDFCGQQTLAPILFDSDIAAERVHEAGDSKNEGCPR